ncbi:9804_t:CDS:2 [Diversispora eburnea]|uniref:9804_t:CDS:1 n=1 Tax=Diversispora eburnea TaxID=1213867 RepID=A0A9N8V9T5_9GLOM|nr:9804_t:CDS:2 [Diversispora eburnea]
MARVWLKILNVLAYFLFTGVNLYSFLFDEDTKKFPGFKIIHQTYISPAPYVYGIWGLIHLLLLGFVIYQFFAKNEEIITEAIGWRFIIITIVNATGNKLYVTILITSALVSTVYYRLRTHAHYLTRTCTWSETLFIHAPFSIYHGWVFVLVVIGGFAAFSEKEQGESPSILMKILVVLALLILETTAVGYIEKFKGDIAGAIVIVWALSGIAVEQDDSVIRWVAVFFAVFTTFHILKAIYQRYISKSETKGAPLLG